MQRFHIIDDGAVILRQKGRVYRQAKVFRRGRDVFAQLGAGFLRLIAGGGTTDPNVSWLDIEAEGVTLDNRRLPRFEGEDVGLSVVGE